MSDTLKEAKQHLRDNWKKGVNCKCCGQFVKRYKRKLNSGMAKTLISIFNHEGKNKVHVKNFLRDHKIQDNQDWTRLKHWGFLEEETNTDNSKKNSGVWNITLKGEAFLLNQTKAPSHIYFYDNKFLGFEEDSLIFISEALGNKFNYKELMNEKV